MLKNLNLKLLIGAIVLIVLSLSGCGSNSPAGTSTTTGTAGQATAAKTAFTGGQTKTSNQQAQLSAKITTYKAPAGVAFMVAPPVNLSQLSSNNPQATQAAIAAAQNAFAKSNVTSAQLATSYGTYTENAATPGTFTFASSAVAAINVHYLNGVWVSFNTFVFGAPAGNLSSFKLDVTSNNGAATPQAQTVTIHITETYSNFDANGFPSTYHEVGSYSFWDTTLATPGMVTYNDDLLLSITLVNGTFAISFNYTITDVTNGATGAPYAHSALTMNITNNSATQDTLALTIVYDDSSTAIVNISETDVWNHDAVAPYTTVNSDTFTASGFVNYQGARVGTIVGGPRTINNLTGVRTGTPINLNWTDGTSSIWVP